MGPPRRGGGGGGGGTEHSTAGQELVPGHRSHHIRIGLRAMHLGARLQQTTPDASARCPASQLGNRTQEHFSPRAACSDCQLECGAGGVQVHAPAVSSMTAAGRTEFSRRDSWHAAVSLIMAAGRMGFGHRDSWHDAEGQKSYRPRGSLHIRPIQHPVFTASGAQHHSRLRRRFTF